MLVLPIAAQGQSSAGPSSADAVRAVWIEAYIARHREDACGYHWVGNPSFAACMAMLRREAEQAYRPPGAPPAPAGPSEALPRR